MLIAEAVPSKTLGPERPNALYKTPAKTANPRRVQYTRVGGEIERVFGGSEGSRVRFGPGLAAKNDRAQLDRDADNVC
jgi:hypothetical protein